MSPKPKKGYTQTIGGNRVPDSIIEKLKYIAECGHYAPVKLSQAKTLEILIDEKYRELNKKVLKELNK